MQASARLDHTVLALDGEHDVHAMVEIVAPERDDITERRPLSIALVLDRSGSMAGRKLSVAKRCASWVAERLGPKDELALVTYDDEVRLLTPLTPVNGGLRRTIQGIRPGGQTNLSGGWLKGLEALCGADDHGVRKVLLLSDGLANVGITDRGTLAGLAAEARAQGIGTTTVGFGADGNAGGTGESLLPCPSTRRPPMPTRTRQGSGARARARSTSDHPTGRL